jgi:hypothetical protein
MPRAAAAAAVATVATADRTPAAAAGPPDAAEQAGVVPAELPAEAELPAAARRVPVDTERPAPGVPLTAAAVV